MRLYNGTNSGINLPLNNGQRLIVSPKSVSGQFLPSIEFLTLIATAYSRADIALILSGASEVQMCSSVSTIPGYIAQSVEEAIERFSEVKPEDVKEEVITNEELINNPEEVKCECDKCEEIHTEPSKEDVPENEEDKKKSKKNK